MGHRACFICIKSDGKREFYYSRHASKYMDEALLGGLVGIARIIPGGTSLNEEEWLAQSGAQDGELLIDYQRKVVIWNGESETHWDPIYRRVFLKMVRPIWKDWDIRWAYNRELDILDYAGYPRKPQYLDHFKQKPRIHLDPARDGSIKERLPGILSIIDSAQQCWLIPLDQTIYAYLLSGPAFFLHWKEVPQLKSLLIDTTSIPFYEEGDPDVPHECWGGIHLNLLEQKLDYWAQYFNRGVEQLISPMWPGWEITIHYDEFEWQERMTNAALAFKIKSNEEIMLEIFLSEKMEAMKETTTQFGTKPNQEGLAIKIVVYAILTIFLIFILWILLGKPVFILKAN